MVCTILNCMEHFLLLVSAITGCILISAFASLLDIPTGITNSTISAIAAAIKKYKSIIKKRKTRKIK